MNQGNHYQQAKMLVEPDDAPRTFASLKIHNGGNKKYIGHNSIHTKFKEQLICSMVGLKDLGIADSCSHR